MTLLEFTYEFLNEVETLGQDEETNLRDRAESHLRSLAKDRRDVIGAAVSLESLVKGERSPHLFQARVVLYARPENIAAVAKRETPANALQDALDAVERQLRNRREKLQERSEKLGPQGARQEIYEMTAQEIYNKFAGDTLPDMWLEIPRDEIAASMRVKEQLNQDDAFYVADQILVAAQGS